MAGHAPKSSVSVLNIEPGRLTCCHWSKGKSKLSNTLRSNGSGGRSVGPGRLAKAFGRAVKRKTGATKASHENTQKDNRNGGTGGVRYAEKLNRRSTAGYPREARWVDHSTRTKNNVVGSQKAVIKHNRN